jgi:hypothetical protein
MPPHRTRTRHFSALLVAIALIAGACAGDAEQGADGSAAPGAAVGSEAASASATPAAPAAFTAAELDAYERGFAREIQLVREARQRASTGRTPEERNEAWRAQQEEQTIPGGAVSAGLSPERYEQVRKAVNGVLQTLDFQGAIDGPMQMDTAHASAEMKRRLASDPFTELAPASAAAMRERLDRLTALWVEYINLVAVAG